MAWNYSNTSVQTTLSAPCAPGDTTVTIVDTTGLPVSFPFSLILDYQLGTVEVVTVTNLVGSTLTVTRGQDGTSAQSHSAGSPVVHGVVARDVQEPQNHIAATSNIHGTGVGAAVVGTSSVQILTNKTISGSSNTITNIADASILTLSASKITGSFATITATGLGTFGSLSVSGSSALTTLTVSSTAAHQAGATFTGGAAAVTRTLVTDVAYSSKITGDTNDRHQALADGTLKWGPGNATQDVTITRALDTAGTACIRSAEHLILGASTTTDGMRVGVVGEGNERFFLRADGQHRWSDGTSFSDTFLYRNAVGVLGADTIKANVSGAGETWHAVSGGVGFAGTWADFGGAVQPLRYRLMPDGTVSLSGGVKTTANVSSPTTIFTLPAGYRPAAQEVFATNISGGYLTIDNTGVVSLQAFAGPVTIGLLGLSHVRFSLSSLT